MNDQRDRGRRKKHHKTDPKQGLPENLVAVFQAWLDDEFRDVEGCRVEPSQSVSLKRFLAASSGSELEPDERLRRLAIHWESECAVMPQPNGWNILKRVYLEALRHDKWEFTFCSYSLSAVQCATFAEPFSKHWASILRDAEGMCHAGLEHVPNSSGLFYSLGKVRYEKRENAKALAAFQAALDQDPRDGWSALYKAHCLHDLKRWPEALAAYRAVDRSAFDGPTAWRGVLVRDQIAACLYGSGEREQAAEAYDECLKQYEKNPGLLFEASYMEAAARQFPERFAQRVAQLFERVGFDVRLRT